MYSTVRYGDAGWTAGALEPGEWRLPSPSSRAGIFFFILKPLYFKLIRRGTGLRRRVRYKLFRGMEVASTSSLVRGRPPARTAAVAPRLGTHSHTVSESGPESMVYPTRSQGGRGCNNWY